MEISLKNARIRSGNISNIKFLFMTSRQSNKLFSLPTYFCHCNTITMHFVHYIKNDEREEKKIVSSEPTDFWFFFFLFFPESECVLFVALLLWELCSSSGEVSRESRFMAKE